MKPTTFLSKNLLTLIALGIAALLSACMVRDGPFESVRGRPLDPTILQGLKQRGATIAEVIETLGAPAEEATRGADRVLTYRTVKERKSQESIAGVPIAESAQRFIETWELTFRNGALTESKSSSRLESR